MIKLTKLSGLGLMCLAIIACSGSGSGSNTKTETPDYNGTWETLYNLAKDDCALVAEEDTGFTDIAIIEQTERSASVSAIGELLTTNSATVRDDGSLVAKIEMSGDIFGDGSFCSLEIATSFNEIDDTTAESLFNLGILCNPGTPGEAFCESHGVGIANRTS